MKTKIIFILSIFSALAFCQPTLIPKNQVDTLGNKNYTKQNPPKLITVIPADKKAVLTEFARIRGAQEIYGFAIGETEVTVKQFCTLMCWNYDEKSANTPMTNITWFEAIYFCNELTSVLLEPSEQVYTISEIEYDDDVKICNAKVEVNFEKKGYRLPTLSEWQFAARGGDKGGWDFKYSGSNNKDEVAVVYDYTGKVKAGKDEKPKAENVATKKPNSLGLYDMSGNAEEWTDTNYSASKRSKISAGGSYKSTKDGINTIDDHLPETYYSYLGFRLCQSLR